MAHLGLVREVHDMEASGSTAVYSSQQGSETLRTFKVYTNVTTVTDQDYK
jgi:hypothetical protein